MVFKVVYSVPEKTRAHSKTSSLKAIWLDAVRTRIECHGNFVASSSRTDHATEDNAGIGFKVALQVHANRCMSKACSTEQHRTKTTQRCMCKACSPEKEDAPRRSVTGRWGPSAPPRARARRQRGAYTYIHVYYYVILDQVYHVISYQIILY